MNETANYDLLVDDDNLSSLIEEYQRMSSVIEDKVTSLSESLDRVWAGAIQSGKTAENLLVFKATVGTLKGETSELSATIRTNIESYVSDMDTADSYLY